MSTPSPVLNVPSHGIHQKLQRARDDIVNGHGLYLGDKDTRVAEHAVWRQIGRQQCLVTKQSADAVDTFNKAAAAGEEDPGEQPQYSMADLSIVVGLITDDDFWMTSCGMWRGPTTACPTFADMKLTCTATVPEDDSVFRRDYSTATKNLQSLMDAKVTPGSKAKKSVFVSRTGSPQKLKLRHILFERLPPNSGSDTASENDDSSEDHKIDNWPTMYDAAKNALADMVDTHRVNPLPAYDVNGNLLKPSTYREQLQGATVVCHFNLSHWFIKSDQSDTYVADIVNIRVLLPPKARAPLAPRKRKLCGTDPMAASSKKRVH